MASGVSSTRWAAPLAGTRATVLGASGFIGRWVARQLSGHGARVSAPVRSDVGRRIVESYAGPDVETFTFDLAPERVGALLDRTQPTVVFNLAGYGVDPTERDEVTARRINHELVESLCAHLARVPEPEGWVGQRLVHVGSALEYGEARGDLREDSPPHATTVYGQTKLAGTLAVERHGSSGLRAVTARLFTVYGAGEHEGRLIPSLIAARNDAGPIALTEGRQRRDFTYVADVAEGLLRLGIARAPRYTTINLATGVLTEVREVVRVLASILHVSPERLAFGALPTRVEEMSHEPVNVGRATEVLGWRPETSVREGLERTVEAVLRGVSGTHT